MKKTLSNIVTDNGSISSARVINIGGFVVGTVLLVYHGLWLDKLDAEVFGLYMLYCGGVYGTGKLIDRKYRSEDDRFSNENTRRLETSGDDADEYSVSSTPDR